MRLGLRPGDSIHGVRLGGSLISAKFKFPWRTIPKFSPDQSSSLLGNNHGSLICPRPAVFPLIESYSIIEFPIYLVASVQALVLRLNKRTPPYITVFDGFPKSFRFPSRVSIPMGGVRLVSFQTIQVGSLNF